MTIQEIRISPRTKDTCAVVHISVEGREYQLYSSGTAISVVNPEARIRRGIYRSLGKCFEEVAEIGTHYKKHGKQLMEYAKRVQEMGKVIV